VAYGTPIAVTGMGVTCAAGADVHELLGHLRAGTTGIGTITSPAFSGFEAPVGGEVPERYLGRTDTVGAPAVDPRDRPLRLAVGAAREALAQSRIDLDTIDPRRIGLVVGKCQTEWSEGTTIRPIHRLVNHLAEHVRAEGPRVLVSTACAASTNAIGIGRDKLWNGEADVVVVGGAEALSAQTFAGFSAMQALSTGPCAPYSVSTGLNLGEGAAFLVLERLDAARTRGAPVLAEVLGYGLSADAYHATAPDPTGRGASAAVERALADAGLDRSAVSYVNGHGTGTPANDRMEHKVMRRVFGDRNVPISSTKSFVGHMLGAAGAVEGVTCVLAIENQLLPPTLHAPDVERDWDIVPNAARPADVDVAVSNNYAFGGNNASVVLARPRAPDHPRSARSAAPVTITGIGLLGAAGVGVDAWRTSLGTGSPRFDELSELGIGHGVFGASMPVLDGRRWAPAGDWRRMDAITRQALGATRLALEDADLPLGRDARHATGVFMGTAFGPVLVGQSFAREASHQVSPVAFSQLTVNAPAGKVCQVLGLRGPTTTIATGAVSGTAALATAVDLVGRGDAPACVVVGTDELFPSWYQIAHELGLLSPDGRPRPYDPDRNGEVLGTSAVALVIEPVDRAVARGARRYADVAGIRHGSECVSGTKLDPTGTRWAEVVRDALAVTDVPADAVQFCAGWASGQAQDDVELAALSAVFTDDLLVAAPKAFTGNCMAASGLVNTAVAAMAVAGGREPLPSQRLGRLNGGAHRSDPVDVTTAVALDADYGANYTATVLTKAATR